MKSKRNSLAELPCCRKRSQGTQRSSQSLRSLSSLAAILQESQMKRFWANCFVLWTLRLLIGGIFIYAGVIKFQDPQAFADSIASFQILPKLSINLFALSLPPFEVIAGTLLIFGRWQRAGAFSILVLTVVFTMALSQALVRGLKVDCGCFGGGEPVAWKTWASLGRDILLIAGTWVIYRRACFNKNPIQSSEDVNAIH